MITYNLGAASKSRPPCHGLKACYLQNASAVKVALAGVEDMKLKVTKISPGKK